jgi:hypothetical protein
MGIGLLALPAVVPDKGWIVLAPMVTLVPGVTLRQLGM